MQTAAVAEPLQVMLVFNTLRALEAKVRGNQMLPLFISSMIALIGIVALVAIAGAARKTYLAVGAIGRELAVLDAPRPVSYRARPVRAVGSRRMVRRVATARLAAA